MQEPKECGILSYFPQCVFGICTRTGLEVLMKGSIKEQELRIDFQLCVREPFAVQAGLHGGLSQRKTGFFCISPFF